MNDYQVNARSALASGSIGGMDVARSLGPVAAQQPPVHAAQEFLDKAIAQLWAEVNDLRNALLPVLGPEPGNASKEAQPQPVPNLVSLRILESANTIGAAAGVLRSLRNRLEV